MDGDRIGSAGGTSGVDGGRIGNVGGCRSHWRPLVSGEIAARARDAAAEVVAELAGRTPKDPGLAGGLAGHSLGCDYLARALGNPALGRQARRAWSGAAAAIERSVSAPWLFGGFPGIAWAGAHLAPRLFPDSATDPLEEIDSALLAFLAVRGEPREVDLVSGLAGLAVYGLERLPGESARRILARIVDRLEEAATPVAGQPGRAWLTPPELLSPHQLVAAPRGHFNLGVAHGMPAIVTVLAAIADAGIEPARAGALADDGLTWIWSQEGVVPGDARFPAWIPAGGGEIRPGRIAWCYGDLGMSLALLLAARTRGSEALAVRAVGLARHAAGIAADRSGVRDAGLCHGSAGNALAFARLANLTGCEALAGAARDWTEYTLAHRRPEPIAGFPAWHARDPVRGRGFGYFPDAGVLTGAMGVAMALAAVATDVEPAWDRFLVASLAA